MHNHERVAGFLERHYGILRRLQRGIKLRPGSHEYLVIQLRKSLRQLGEPCPPVLGKYPGAPAVRRHVSVRQEAKRSADFNEGLVTFIDESLFSSLALPRSAETSVMPHQAHHLLVKE